MKKWRFIIASLFWAMCGLANALDLTLSQPPSVWLEKVTQAARLLNYQGVFLHQYGSDIRHYRLTHIRDGANELELREIVNGPTRKYYRVNNSVTVLWADGYAVALDRRDALKLFPDQLSNSIKDIVHNYVIAFAGKETIAGRDTQILALTPKDEYRYPYRFWIHPESGLLLKSVMLDKKNQPLEVFSFSSLTLPISIDKKIFIPPKNTQITTLTIPKYAMAEPSIKKLPAGFTLIRHVRRLLGKDTMASQYLYSDGLVAVSVFIEPLRRPINRGLSAHAGTYAYVTQSGAYQITALGDVPSVTVEAFAQAFEFS